MSRNITRMACALAIAGTLVLSGCQTVQTDLHEGISVVREETSAEYMLSTAKKGDITLTENVRAKYFAARQESYGFGATGLYYDAFAVSVGDEVKAGDILATLDCQELDAQVASREAAISELSRTLTRNRSLIALFDERMTDRTITAAESMRRRGYEVAIRDAEDSISILTAELDELRRQREGRIITSAIDGTVTYVRAIEPGETSVNGKVVITVTDFSSCAFTASVEHPESLSIDEIYTLTINGANYELSLTTPEALGIEPEPMNAASTLTRVYFALLTPSVDLTADSSGSFTVEVDARKDVVYIPVTALTEIDGQPCVYVPNESGLGSIRPVEVGLITSRYAEIISGLDAGENVILY